MVREMSQYRIVETEFASGRILYTVEYWVPAIAGPGGKWALVESTMKDKQAAVDYVARRKEEELDSTVVRTVELDDKGKAK